MTWTSIRTKRLRISPRLKGSKLSPREVAGIVSESVNLHHALAPLPVRGFSRAEAVPI